MRLAKAVSRRRFLKGVGGTAAALSLAGGPGRLVWSQDGRPELFVRLFTGADMTQLDPAKMGVAADWFIANQIFSGLVRFIPGAGDVEPDLAERWEISDDAREFTFFLRQGVQWHRGFGEVTAEDVAFTFERYADPSSGSIFTGNYRTLSGTEVIDRYTVKLVFSEPNVPFILSDLPLRHGFILPKNALQELGDEAFAQNPVGSGPFSFEGRIPGTEVVLAAHDAYYAGAPTVSKVRMLPIIDETAVVVALKRGEIDIANLTTSEARSDALEDAGLSVTEQRSIAQRYLMFNPTVEPLDQVEVRRAIHHAIDRPSISRFVYDNLHPAAFTYFPPTVKFQSGEITTYDYDPDRARALLAEAGLPNGFSTSILVSNRAVSTSMAEAIQAMLAEVGIDVTLDILEHGAYTAKRKEDPDNVPILQHHFGRSSDPDSILSGALDSSSFPPGQNLAQASAVDELIARGKAEPDEATRRQIYLDIQEQIALDTPIVPLVNTTVVYATTANITNFQGGANFEFWAYPAHKG